MVGLRILALIAVLGAASCGYSWQRAESAYLKTLNVASVYVEPTANASYKPGAESVIHNALLKTLLARKSLKLVSKPEDADAILKSTVTQASFSPAGTANANYKDFDPLQLIPDNSLPGPENKNESGFAYMSIATLYAGTLGASFSLSRLEGGKEVKVLWTDSESRAKVFPANNLLDVAGTTSALINESEFDRALQELAVQIAADAHDSLVAAF